MTPRTVLHVTDSRAMGGMEAQIVTIMRSLDRATWDPVLVHHGDPAIAPMVDAVREAGMADWCVPRMPDGPRGALRVPGFARALRARQPPVMHAHLAWPLGMKWSLAAARLARVPAIVASVHLTAQFDSSRWIRWQQRRISAGVDRYIAVSGSVAESCRQACGWPADRITVIANGIDTAPVEAGDRARGRALLGAVGDQPLVLTLARLEPEKGLETVARAAALVPDTRFVVAGEGADRAELEALIAGMGLSDRVVLPGRMTQVPDLLAACDLFVLPSRHEGMPIAIIEAMAAGTPVIASDIPGTNEIIEHGVTGLLVRVDDPTGLADAIRTVLDDGALRDRLVTAARNQVAARHTAAFAAERIAVVYAEELARANS